MTYLHPGFEYKFTFKKYVRVSGYGLDGSGFVCRLVQENFSVKFQTGCGVKPTTYSISTELQNADIHIPGYAIT